MMISLMMMMRMTINPLFHIRTSQSRISAQCIIISSHHYHHDSIISIIIMMIHPSIPLVYSLCHSSSDSSHQCNVCAFIGSITPISYHIPIHCIFIPSIHIRYRSNVSTLSVYPCHDTITELYLRVASHVSVMLSI